MNTENIRKAKNFEELLDLRYGKTGTPKRDAFEEKVPYFVISEMLKEANLTQERLAGKQLPK